MIESAQKKEGKDHKRQISRSSTNDSEGNWCRDWQGTNHQIVKVPWNSVLKISELCFHWMLNEMSSHVKLRINAHFLEWKICHSQSKLLQPKLMNLVEIYLFCLSSCGKNLRNLWKAYLRWWHLIHKMHIHWKAIIQRFYHFQKYQDVNSVLDKNPDSSLVALEKPPLSNLKPILENVCGIFSLASCREQYPCRKIIPKNITLKRLESAVRNILELTESEPLFFFINDKILRVDSVSLLIILLVFSNESHLYVKRIQRLSRRRSDFYTWSMQKLIWRLNLEYTSFELSPAMRQI